MRWKIKTRDASLAGNSTTRVVHAVGTALAVGAVSALLLVQPTYAASIQNFDTDPGWTRFNNPANSNDFGFQDSNLAGGTAGEAGGFFSVTSVPVWYGDESVGNFGGNDALSASGILNIRSVDPPYNNNVFIGHFDNGGFSIGGQNGIGFQVNESAAQVGTSEFRVFYLAGTAEGLLFTIDGLDLTRTWSYNYDPSAGSFGSLTISISGPGGATATHFLSSGQRGSIGSIETFGLAVKPHTVPVSTAQAEIYVDNLSYTSSHTSSLRITICHMGMRTKTFSRNAVPAHLRHGDFFGACPTSGLTAPTVLGPTIEPPSPLKIWPMKTPTLNGQN